jgi:hypothetical protein
MRVLAPIALLLLAAPAFGYHRQTPPIVRITETAGDAMLPRVPAAGHRLALALESNGRQIFRQDRRHNILEAITLSGENDNPTISSNGGVIAWEADCDAIGCADPGQQIFSWSGGTIVQITHDPTGTSSNPALSGGGSRLAFESTGDLAHAGNTGSRQVFVRTNDGIVTQLSQGQGMSRNPALSRSGRFLVYDSTGNTAGTDTGTAQIWVATSKSPAAPITAGGGDSQRPAITGDGRYLAFESTADLTGDQHDTGVSQIFAYEVRDGTLTRVTNDPQGCNGASISKVPRDWRIGFSCHGRGFFHHVLEGQTYRLPIDAGDTPQAVTELGGHFMVVSTTANLTGSGTTAKRQVYMLNLFKLTAEPVDTTAGP